MHHKPPRDTKYTLPLTRNELRTSGEVIVSNNFRIEKSRIRDFGPSRFWRTGAAEFAILPYVQMVGIAEWEGVVHTMMTIHGCVDDNSSVETYVFSKPAPNSHGGVLIAKQALVFLISEM